MASASVQALEHTCGKAGPTGQTYSGTGVAQALTASCSGMQQGQETLRPQRARAWFTVAESCACAGGEPPRAQTQAT